MAAPKKFGNDVKVEPLGAGVPKQFGADVKVEPIGQEGGGMGATPSFVAKPGEKEGRYKMVGPQGQQIEVSFSQVPEAQMNHYAVAEGRRYQKDLQAAKPNWLTPKHTGQPGMYPSDWARGAASGLAGMIDPRTYVRQADEAIDLLHTEATNRRQLSGFAKRSSENFQQQGKFAAENPGYTVASILAPMVAQHGLGKVAELPSRARRAAAESAAKTRPFDTAEMVRDTSTKNALATEKARTATEANQAKVEGAREKQAEGRKVDLKKYFEKSQKARGEEPTSLESGRDRSRTEGASRKEAVQHGLRREDHEIRGQLKNTRDREHSAADLEYKNLKTLAKDQQADPAFLPDAVDTVSQELPEFRSDPTFVKDVERFVKGGDIPTFEDLQDLRSRLGGELSKGTLPGKTFKAYSNLQDRIDGEMERIITRADPSKAGALQHAQQRWRQMKETFYDPNSVLGKFIGAEKGQKFNPEETFGPLRGAEGAVRDLSRYSPELANRLNRVRNLYGETRGVRGAGAAPPTPAFPPRPAAIPDAAPVEAKTTTISPGTLQQMKAERVYQGGRTAEGANHPIANAARGIGGGVAAMWGHPILGAASIIQAVRGGAKGAMAGMLQRPGMAEELARITPADLRAIDKLRPSDKAALTDNFRELVQEANRRGVRVSPALSAYVGLAAAQGNAQDQVRRGVGLTLGGQQTQQAPQTPPPAADQGQQIQNLEDQNQDLQDQNQQLQDEQGNQDDQGGPEF